MSETQLEFEESKSSSSFVVLTKQQQRSVSDYQKQRDVSEMIPSKDF